MRTTSILGGDLRGSMAQVHDCRRSERERLTSTNLHSSWLQAIPAGTTEALDEPGLLHGDTWI